MFKKRLNDIIVEVDAETYKQLEDPTFALQYYKLAKTAFSKDCEPQFSSLWKSSKNPTEEDHLATLELLSLRKILHSEFEDKKTHKNELWTKVAKEMNAKGFYVGSEVAEGREKVRQKFANLQKCYIKYFDTQRSTGEGKLVKPKYFDELDEILGDKHKVNPVKIIDSSSNKSDLADENKPSVSHCNVTKSDTVDSHASTCSGGRFQQVKKRLRPVSEKNTILKELVSIEKEKQQERKEEFARMMEMFNTQNEQRHTQMMAMINTMNKKQKRKHHSSSSENVEELSARLGLMAASNSEHELLKEAGLSPSSPPDANYLNSKCLYLEQLLSERKEGDKVRTLPRGNVYIEESNSKGQ